MKFVKNIYHYLQRLLAKFYFKFYFRVEVIGITGSVGKTTIKEMTAAVLSENFKTIATFANIDPIYNIPLTIFKLRPGVEKLVVELSIDRPGDMDKYFRMVMPLVGVFCPIYWTHTEFLGDLAGVIKEKGKLACVLPKKGFLVLNRDDKNEVEIAKKTKAKILYYGLDKRADIYAQNIKDDSLAGVSFEVWEKKTGKLGEIKLKLLGYQNVYSSLAAVMVGRINNMSFDKIKRGLEKVEPLSARMNVVELANGANLIDDSYNSSPLAAKASLKAVARLNLKGKKIAVLGEMKELGDYADMGHREVGGAVVDYKFDVLVVLGRLTGYLADEARKSKRKIDIYEVKSISEIAKILKKILVKGDVVLVKGSRFAHMERIALRLMGKKINCDEMTCKKYISCGDCGEL